jgi:copper amine oxidase-like protein
MAEVENACWVISINLYLTLAQTWRKPGIFKFKNRFNGREGMVLHQVNYKDDKKVRPLLYRASLSEMFIPYGDPRYPYQRKAVSIKPHPHCPFCPSNPPLLHRFSTWANTA